MKKEYAVMIQGALAGAGAYLSAKLGVLYPVLGVLAIMMIVDYFTGMAASRVEAIDHPNDPNYGWSSKKGAKGIIKKGAYLCAIIVGAGLDYILLKVSAELGIEIQVKAFFGLLVAVWVLLNEMLSITENAGRMGAPVPEWLVKYIAVLRDKIDSKAE